MGQKDKNTLGGESGAKASRLLALVVDDHPFIRHVLGKFLAPRADMSEIDDGALLIEAYKEWRPDLVFLDLNVPPHSGKDLLKDLLEVDPNAFVVILSGDSSRENVQYAIEHGAKGFVTKPFTREVISRYMDMAAQTAMTTAPALKV